MSSQTDNFQDFYTNWRDEQTRHLDALIAASNRPDPSLDRLVEHVVGHYEKYYVTKTECAYKDTFLLLSPPWTTGLEDAHLWVGGWRPTTAFHLLYSKSGLHLEANLSDIINDMISTRGDLGCLSPVQLGLMDELHRITVHEETKITEKAAKQQEKVADRDMVELSHVMSESVHDDDDERVESVIKPKEEGFQVILQSADDLRMRTIKGVVHILSPIQAVHFLIAAAELQLRLHDWGKVKDEKQTNDNDIQDDTNNNNNNNNNSSSNNNNNNNNSSNNNNDPISDEASN